MYNHQTLEAKWQKHWLKKGTFHVENTDTPSRMVMAMFPYPSAAGLHVGHPVPYTTADIFSRFYRMKGLKVLQPMGWDAFGLPAENYAIKHSVHPDVSTKENIKNFRRQLQALGLAIDWEREIDTSSPEYYRWTQWIFLQLYKRGLAVRQKAPVNWCPSCQTVLANEQVIDGHCERCQSEVIQKELKQWFFKITNYAEELLEDLGNIAWPEHIKTMQKNWIGKSMGAELHFAVSNTKYILDVFTTRPDTLYGATYMVLAPEHPLVLKITDEKHRIPVEQYQKKTATKSHLERTSLEKEKVGVFTGAYATNPVNGEKLPVWIADYVVMDYGTGAIMAVPAHDERDLAFAKKYQLPVRNVVETQEPFNENKAATGEGTLMNSGPFDGMKTSEAVEAITKHVGGKPRVQYRLRDWLVSRQRYWGAPIPIIYCESCGEAPVPEKDLPVVLPTDVDFRPTGESPLAQSKSFHKVKCPQCKKSQGARREVDTMDTFVCSSWYYLRYTDPRNTQEPFTKESLKGWVPVHTYVGGAEHAVLHLLYARFLAKALRDAGVTDFDEPFQRFIAHGLILAEDGQKMSKSLGNVINPDEVIADVGADTLRVYEMFMGPLEDSAPWDTKGIMGARRFLEKLYQFATHWEDKKESEETKSLVHRTLIKVEKDIESAQFNTAISSLMILLNHFAATQKVSKASLEMFLQMLSPFAPHLCEELWEKLGHAESITESVWPTADKQLAEQKTLTIAVQVSGKVRATLEVTKDMNEETVKARARDLPNVAIHLKGKKIVKEIVVPWRIVNFVVQ